MISLARPIRLSPATASSVASATPSSSLRNRVSTFPRNGTARQVRPVPQHLRRPPDRRRPEPRALRQLIDARRDTRHERVPHVLALKEHRQDQPIRQHRRQALLECTPRSISPPIKAASISRENSPLPPAVLSGASLSRSPLVVTTRISTAPSAQPWASRSSRATRLACTKASAEPRVPSRKIGACDCNPTPSYCRPMAPCKGRSRRAWA